MVNKKNKQPQSLNNLYGDSVLELDLNTYGPFGDNQACAYAYKKTEKILIALHLVTNSVPEKEPARKNVRDKSVGVLSDILKLRSGFKSTGSNNVGNVIASLYEVMSLLDVLHVAGFISGMNLSVLKKELGELIVFLRESTDSELAEKVTFEDGHFNTEQIVKRHGIKNSNMSLKIKDTKKTQVSNKSVLAKHNERSATILKLIKDKGEVNVKDISSVITDCSEKTIQRELISLINKGVLKKEGERRWSVYSLV